MVNVPDVTPHSETRKHKNVFQPVADSRPDTRLPPPDMIENRLEEHGRPTFEAVLERSVRRGVMGHDRRERAA